MKVYGYHCSGMNDKMMIVKRNPRTNTSPNRISSIRVRGRWISKIVNPIYFQYIQIEEELFNRY
jgi:hypothetical protein